MTIPNPKSVSCCSLNRFSRLLADVAMEPYRQSLLQSHARLMSDMNGGAAERARLMIEENRRG